jgi:hypothetical protein
MQVVEDVVLEFDTEVCSFTVRKFHVSNFAAFTACSKNNP